MPSSARYSGPVSETPATVGVGTRQPGAYACAVISTTLAPRITNAQKMNEWSTPAYHSRATFRWKIPYTTKFFTRVGRRSHRGSFRWAVNRYRSRRYIFRPKIDKATARKAVTTTVSRAVRAMSLEESALPFSTRGCCEDDQFPMVRGHGFPSPSSPDAEDPPTRLSEAPGDVPWREEGELCGRIGAVLQVLADALVELPLQSQHAGHGVERSELVLLERPDCVECERPLSRREEVAVQEVQDEPTFGADVCLKTTKECEVVRGGPPTQRMVQAQNRVESGPRRQSRKRVAGRGGEVEALDDGIGNSLGCRGNPHLVRIDGSDLESGFREPHRPSADPARHIEEVRPGCDAFPLEEHPNRLDVLQWRANDPSRHSSPPDDDLGRAVD